jgi:hypothetical protein
MLLQECQGSFRTVTLSSFLTSEATVVFELSCGTFGVPIRSETYCKQDAVDGRNRLADQDTSVFQR